jgi:L-aspartate semialdehyde sulfurtransferase ferredoxin
MMVNNPICLHCGACVGSCPTNSIFLHETAVIEFQSTCSECGFCALVCPVGAISLASQASVVSPNTIIPEIRQ